MNSYREWWKSDKTVEFFKALAEKNGKVNMSLVMQRQPLDGYVRYNKNQ